MPNSLRPRHLIVLLLSVALLLFGLWRGIAYENIQGDNGAGYMLGFKLSPWMLVAWIAGVLLLFFAWRRRA